MKGLQYANEMERVTRIEHTIGTNRFKKIAAVLGVHCLPSHSRLTVHAAGYTFVLW